MFTTLNENKMLLDEKILSMEEKNPANLSVFIHILTQIIFSQDVTFSKSSHPFLLLMINSRAFWLFIIMTTVSYLLNFVETLGHH